MRIDAVDPLALAGYKGKNIMHFTRKSLHE
jgi:hypothetical protein